MRACWPVVLLVVIACSEEAPGAGGARPDGPRPRDAAPLDARRPDAPRADAGAGGAGRPDAARADGPTMDAPMRMDASVGPDAAACDLATPGAADRTRVVLVGHGFSATPGVDGHDVRTLSLSAAGELAADGIRLDVGTRPARIGFLPSGTIALVLGEDGTLVSLRVRDARTLEPAGRVTLPPGGYGDLAIATDGRSVLVPGSNVTTAAGVSRVLIACDGALSIDAAAFYGLRLADAVALLPGGRALVLGGQATFAPEDPRDVRILSVGMGAITELAAFDVFHDVIDATRIATSPDGTVALVPNASPFSAEGGQLAVLALDLAASPPMLRERGRLMNLADAHEVAFATDGHTALVARVEPGRVTVLSDAGGAWAVTGEVAGVGLADALALVRRGSLRDLVLVSSVDASAGSNVARLRVTAPGTVSDLGQLPLGMGAAQIPGALDVQP